MALVKTSDLFEPARYLAICDDSEYAAKCRKAIADGSGQIVVFPEPPKLDVPNGDAAAESDGKGN